MTYYLFRDVWLKGVALSLAVLLWLNVAGDPVVERGMEVPLEFENVPVALEIAGDPPDTVSVRLRGTSQIVSRLESAEVVAVLDLWDERPGRQLFDMFDGRIKVPSGIEVTSIVPATLSLMLERKGVPRTVQIVPDIEGRPAEGLAIGRITTDPSSVEVVGPATKLAELREALTGPVSVARATANVETDVTVAVADPTLRLVEPVLARVLVEIVPAPVEQTLNDVPVASRYPFAPELVMIDPAWITVGVRGPRDVMLELDTTAVRGFVDLTGLPPGRYHLPVIVDSDSDVSVIRIDPPSVQVNLR